MPRIRKQAAHGAVSVRGSARVEQRELVCRRVKSECAVYLPGAQSEHECLQCVLLVRAGHYEYYMAHRQCHTGIFVVFFFFFFEFRGIFN